MWKFICLKKFNSPSLENIDNETKVVGISGIIRFPNENNTDQIVIDLHGHSGFKRIILGSVAAKVIKDSDCHVMIIKN